MDNHFASKLSWYRTSHPGRLKLLFSPGWYVSISDVLPIESKAMYDSWIAGKTLHMSLVPYLSIFQMSIAYKA